MGRVLHLSGCPHGDGDLTDFFVSEEKKDARILVEMVLYWGIARVDDKDMSCSATWRDADVFRSSYISFLASCLLAICKSPTLCANSDDKSFDDHSISICNRSWKTWALRRWVAEVGVVRGRSVLTVDSQGKKPQKAPTGGSSQGASKDKQPQKPSSQQPSKEASVQGSSKEVGGRQ